MVTAVRTAGALALILCARTAAADEETSTEARVVSASAVATVYAAFGTYAYFAWFDGAHQVPFFVVSDWRDEGPFALHSYAGGADKWGHFWSNYIMTRGTTELLVAGGWPRLASSLVIAGLTETAFALSEVKDGFVWGFEVGDFAMNMAGAGLAVLMENVPAIDRLFDFRLQYWPSRDYRALVKNMPFFQRGNGVDFTQDYSGQSYMLALHLRGIDALATPRETAWTRYVDVVAGFETRGFEPVRQDMAIGPNQTFYFGVAVNMQAVLDALFAPSLARRLGDGAFEVVSLPGTTFRYAELQRVLPP
jgi:hypothetical protein